jgi:hypothetical protein
MKGLFLFVSLVLAAASQVRSQPGKTYDRLISGDDAQACFMSEEALVPKAASTVEFSFDSFVRISEPKPNLSGIPLRLALCKRRKTPVLTVKGERVRAGEVVLGRSRYAALALVIDI